MRNKKFMELGRIVAMQGIKGEVRVQPWCDSPEFLLQFETVFFDEGEVEIEVEKSRSHKNVVVMKFPNIDTVEEANKLRNKVIYMNRDDIELPKGVYYVQDLIGLDIKDVDTDVVYGTLIEVTKTGASDVYHVQNQETNKMYYVPAVPKFIMETNLEQNYMTVRPIKGMFDDEYESIKD